MRDVLSILHDKASELSKSERILADLIRSNAEFIVHAGITEVAEKAGVSPPTVTRFARRLGCESFTAFKVQLAQATFAGLRYLEVNETSDQPTDVADSLLAQSQNILTLVRDQLDLKAIEAATQAISKASYVVSFGSGGTSSMIAEELRNRLFRLGLRATSSTDHAIQLMQSATLAAGDVVIASSVSGRNDPLVEAMEAAQIYGATVIALTRPGRPVSKAANITIPIDVPEHGHILRPSSSRYAFLYVVDVLATLVAISRAAPAQESLRRVKHQLTNARDENDKEALGD
ncbi:hex regulon repressor [Roseibium sp. TrichSKD4]|uniref:MurR/RpiR family transcriptional regulator n=1 Tax=Roseibium sp. TrichSKD4 TaxID=744980 RepID=UPI0001E57652|nr:MurR/RpiR family transcriptional regulator [Roseibium sp. TrichSKD4]EFO30038.1 hex regulon repressor [Roseibium sp. TrichSKD4]